MSILRLIKRIELLEVDTVLKEIERKYIHCLSENIFEIRCRLFDILVVFSSDILIDFFLWQQQKIYFIYTPCNIIHLFYKACNVLSQSWSRNLFNQENGFLSHVLIFLRSFSLSNIFLYIFSLLIVANIVLRNINVYAL